VALQVPGYHISLVVEDVPEAMEELGKLLGLEWSPVMEMGETKFVYSKQGPPYLEMVERQPGTMFGELGLNHLGVWVDDMRVESDRMAELGCPLESVSKGPDGEWLGGCFHSTSAGLRVELVQIGTSGPKLLRFLGGGDYA
jgi:Glyoxalase/Bleomycin resistance protein/Dioxygenase superfamily